ncbi:hypothetical protein BDY24DRAFT_402961 [Mrakia frigida]|uniref:uncharacterized protein n=1 Tax=Mrakia frigida TaxID=29902 RepID=UPI003FCC1390
MGEEGERGEEAGRVGLRCGGRRRVEDQHHQQPQPSVPTTSSSSSASRPSSYLLPNPLLQPTSSASSSSTQHGCGALVASLPSSASPIELVFTRTENDDPSSGSLRVKRRVLEAENVWGIRGQGEGLRVGLQGEIQKGRRKLLGCGCEREEVGCLNW